MRKVLFVGGGCVAVAALAVTRRYRRDLRSATARLDAVERSVVATEWGAVEYAERGAGEPVLVLHGIFGGCDNGLFSVEDLCPNRRVIAVSRFGYLGSSLPPGASAADQADALVPLLDALGLDAVDVIGISAGATSALELALRHPDRVRHLVVLVGNVPGSPTAVVQPGFAKLLDRQLPVWLMKTYFPRLMRRHSGVPGSLPLTEADERSVADFLDTIFPLTPRVPGVLFDAFVSNAAVHHCDLESIRVPTLLVHTRDDNLASHDASEAAAARITGARFLSLESGGHLLLGQDRAVRDALEQFLTADVRL